MVLRKIEKNRQISVQALVSGYLADCTSQVEVVGQFSNGAINDHFLIRPREGGDLVWRQRNPIVLPAKCQNSLSDEASIVSELNRHHLPWAPELVTKVGSDPVQGLLFEYIDGKDDPKHFSEACDWSQIWKSLAEIMGELHDVRLPTPLMMNLRDNELSKTLASMASWVAGYHHPLSGRISSELNEIVENLSCRTSEPVLCHNDFRMGNFLKSASDQIFLLDWEFASLGEREQDVGWLFAPCWRYSNPGGLESDLAHFVSMYQDLSGHLLDAQRIEFWRYVSQVRWSAIALMQEWRLMQKNQMADYSSEPQQDPLQAFTQAERLKENLIL
jgi:aminoglycoside phosphotransferase (APT) family kinase protein